jgi:transcriptional regulator with XRE-family HTH domain
MSTAKKESTSGRSSPRIAASPAMLARSLRRRRSLTLEQLAQDTGLSKGHLSRYERGEKSLSIAALVRLSKALNTSVSALLGEHAGEELLHVVRSGERPRRRAARTEGNYEFVPLSRTDEHAGPSAFIVHMGTESTLGKEVFHEGDELFFVLSGSVEIVLGSRSVRLGQGDFAQFPGLVRHRLRGLESNTSILVFVTGENRR